MTSVSLAVSKRSHAESTFCKIFIYSACTGLVLTGGNYKNSLTVMTVIPEKKCFWDKQNFLPNEDEYVKEDH